MFDPALPATGSALESAVMRSQLTSLKALIDALLTVTAAQVDATATLPPGSPATVSVTVEGNTLHFSFGIPQGQPGDPGPPGEVTEAQLAAGLETRAHQVSSVDSLNLTPEAEYSPAQLEEVVTKLNEALNALKGN